MRKQLEAWFLYFLLYSFLGWVYEVFLEVVVYRWGYSDRGVLLGPYCIIYGVGALILVFSLRGLQRKRIYLGPVSVTPVLVFLGIVVLTTALELIGSYVMEWTTGSWLWDYRRFAFNFQGRVALNPSLRSAWGAWCSSMCSSPSLKSSQTGCRPGCSRPSATCWPFSSWRM